MDESRDVNPEWKSKVNKTIYGTVNATGLREVTFELWNLLGHIIPVVSLLDICIQS